MESPRQRGSNIQSPTPSPSECDICGGMGWVAIEGEGARACICQRERAIRRELPPRYHGARLADFSAPVRERIARWLKNPADGLLLCGPAGCGKTFLSAAIVRERIETRRKCAFRRMAQLYADLREAFRADTAESEVLRPYIDSEMIVLDDLGAGALSDFERRAALDVVDARLNSLRPTIVTTNLDLDEISAKLDDRLASRLSTYEMLRLAGADRRLARPQTVAVSR